MVVLVFVPALIRSPLHPQVTKCCCQCTNLCCRSPIEWRRDQLIAGREAKSRNLWAQINRATYVCLHLTHAVHIARCSFKKVLVECYSTVMEVHVELQLP